MACEYRSQFRLFPLVKRDPAASDALERKVVSMDGLGLRGPIQIAGENCLIVQGKWHQSLMH